MSLLRKARIGSRWLLIGMFGMWFGLSLGRAAILAQWNFNGATDTNHPAPSSGTGTATVLGGLNAQFSAGTGSSDPAGTNDLALSLTHFPAQGKANRSAGVEFEVNTAGFQSVSLRFDLRASSTASRKAVILVAEDGAPWVEAGSFVVGVDGVFTNGLTIPLGAISGTSDRTRLTVRIVSDFASGTNYAAVKSGSTYSTAGTWRIDMVTFNADPKDPPPTAPVLLEPPHALTVEAGTEARLRVSAGGSEPLRYQWLKDGQEIPGAIASTWLAMPAWPTNAGSYQVRIENSVGQLISEPAILTVVLPDAPTLESMGWIESPIRPGEGGTNAFSERVVCPGERLRLSVLATDRLGREMKWKLDRGDRPQEVQWRLDPASNEATLAWSPAESDAGQSLRLEAEASVWMPAPMEAVVSRATWTVYVPTLAEQLGSLTEWMVFPAEEGQPGFNPLNRAASTAVPQKEDTFLEWVNLGAVPISLQGWTVWLDGRLWHRFALATEVVSSNALVVFGGGSIGNPPRLPVPVQSASEQAMTGVELRPGSWMEIRNARSNLVQRVRLAADGIPTGVSAMWDPGAPLEYVPHPVRGSVRSSAGLRSDGSPWRQPVVDPVNEMVQARVSIASGQSIVVEWEARSGVRYRVERSTSPSGPFATVFDSSDGSSFSEQLGPAGWSMYYRVRTP